MSLYAESHGATCYKTWWFSQTTKYDSTDKNTAKEFLDDMCRELTKLPYTDRAVASVPPFQKVFKKVDHDTLPMKKRIFLPDVILASKVMTQS